jgi:hypothetical protein
MGLRSDKRRFLYGFLLAPAVMILFVLYSAWLGRSDTELVESFCSERSCACADWDRNRAGPYVIENNVWNKGDLRSYQQCVYMDDDEGEINAGWAWNWPGIRFNVVAYPNIIYGKNPWLPSTTPKLPIRIDEIPCLEAEFEVIQSGSGKGNLAFDLWITDSDSAQPSDITHEIMIWLSHSGIRPAGSKVDTLHVDGIDLGLWKKENHNPSEDYEWTFLAYVYPSPHTEGSIDLKDLLDYLVDGGYLRSDAYLAAIQLGNEIVSGHGQTLISTYEIRLCDE